MTASTLPTFIFASTDRNERKRIAELKTQKKIHPIGPRLYTSIPKNTPNYKSKIEASVRGQWLQVVSGLFPGALLSHRTAIEFTPTASGCIFITSNTNRILTYPGLTINFIRGHKPLSTDFTAAQLKVSSLPRALLENFQPSKSKADRSLTEEKLEELLSQILIKKGEKELNLIRDQAKKIATQLGLKSGFKKLDQCIGGLLSTRTNEKPKSKIGKALAAGLPYDSSVIERLNLLFSNLNRLTYTELIEKRTSSLHQRHKAFFESYFSNYIEGTTFEINEAENIVFDHKIPKARSKDGHDVLGTFKLVSDLNEMRRTPKSFSELEDILKHRHSTLLEYRPELNPGHYKTKPNRAGDTFFVEPSLVRGTLYQGFELYSSLIHGLPKSIFIMFLISEVHPFVDGNGRVARIMMNAELVSAQQTTIIIPNVFREDYLLTLRALSRRNRTEPLINMLSKAQQASNLDFTDYPKILKELEKRNWFKEPSEGLLIYS